MRKKYGDQRFLGASLGSATGGRTAERPRLCLAEHRESKRRIHHLRKNIAVEEAVHTETSIHRFSTECNIVALPSLGYSDLGLLFLNLVDFKGIRTGIAFSVRTRTPEGRIRSEASGRVLSQERLGRLHHRYNRAA
jgi:hypothetical protein